MVHFIRSLNSPPTNSLLSSRWKVGNCCIIVSLSSQVAPPSSTFHYLVSHSSLAPSLSNIVSRVNCSSNSTYKSGGNSCTIWLAPTSFKGPLFSSNHQISSFFLALSSTALSCPPELYLFPAIVALMNRWRSSFLHRRLLVLGVFHKAPRKE